MPARTIEIPPGVHADVQILDDLNQMHNELRPGSVGIGLGSPDDGAPTYTAELYQRGMCR